MEISPPASRRFCVRPTLETRIISILCNLKFIINFVLFHPLLPVWIFVIHRGTWPVLFHRDDGPLPVLLQMWISEGHWDSSLKWFRSRHMCISAYCPQEFARCLHSGSIPSLRNQYGFLWRSHLGRWFSRVRICRSFALSHPLAWFFRSLDHTHLAHSHCPTKEVCFHFEQSDR